MPAAGGDGPAALAATLWDLAAWTRGAEELRAAMEATTPDRIAAGFRVAAAVVRHLRDDPLLPAELLPTDWPGDRLRSDYDVYEHAFQAALAPVLQEARPGEPAISDASRRP